jgi:hypothetical protein
MQVEGIGRAAFGQGVSRREDSGEGCFLDSGLLWLKGLKSCGEGKPSGFLRQAQDRLFDCDAQKRASPLRMTLLWRGQSSRSRS